jgi:Tol biopolymer transport system component
MLPLAEPGQPSLGHFSPDGSHYAFAVRGRGAITVYEDGVPQSAFNAIESNQSIYTFSPDGKHIAYFCSSSNPAAGNDRGVCVDGKYVPVGQGYVENLTFSSDSNHLFWAKRVGRGFRMFADGKPVLDGGLPAPGGFAGETWQSDGDNGMLVMLQDATGMKRASVKPSSQTSLASMLGNGSGSVATR